MNKNTKYTIIIVSVLMVGLLPSIYALEGDTSYFLDDGESISILVTVDNDGTASIDEIFLTMDGLVSYEVTNNNIIHAFIHDNGNFGRILGKTDTGETIYVFYHVLGNESVSLKAKIWNNDKTTEKIISTGEIISLF